MSFSATARIVALGVHCEARPGRAHGLPAATLRLAARATPAWLLPGIAAHYVARKACVGARKRCRMRQVSTNQRLAT